MKGRDFRDEEGEAPRSGPLNESLAIEVNTGISSKQVTRVPERVIEERGAPGAPVR
ncbi:MAG: hypothetical protein M3N93_00475 [Acidobacteriota bacterium]|nr:hypothetical protein [Acidobacteriota bacterium]